MSWSCLLGKIRPDASDLDDLFEIPLENMAFIFHERCNVLCELDEKHLWFSEKNFSKVSRNLRSQRFMKR